jgi:hypothetical protein
MRLSFSSIIRGNRVPKYSSIPTAISVYDFKYIKRMKYRVENEQGNYKWDQKAQRIVNINGGDDDDDDYDSKNN